MKRPLRLLAVLVAAVVAVVAVVTVVKASDGAFNGQYQLTGTFQSSGEGLYAGSAVTYRGVQVGRVTGISLQHGMAHITMAIDPTFKVPADATATVAPENVFGADNVVIDYPAGDTHPTLAAGSAIFHTGQSPELGDLFAAADPLLAKIDAPDLTTIVSNLAQASEGEGPTIAASIDEGVKLADFLDRTLPQQLSALDSFSGFAASLVPTASSLNAIAAASNQGLPVFNAHAAQYKALLQSLAPFAENLAQFLAAYHPDISTLLSAGDNVARVLLVQQQDIGQVIQGLGVYLTKFAGAVDPSEVLPDGSHFGYFHTFIMLSDINNLVCSLIAPAQPGLSFLAPLQQALSGAGTPLNCSSQIAAFNAAQNSGKGTSSSAAAQAASNLSTQTYEGLTAPQAPSSPSTLGSLINALLGGSSTSNSGGLLGGSK
ncbi:MAG TPA: MCE family protein [Acidimicrobiales bacterium]|nr:MCE family protein [Acidimicrobiales bacterium]